MGDNRGRVFDGALSGSTYDRMAGYVGFGIKFYRKAASLIPLRPGMRILDMGCGTGAFMLAVYEQVVTEGRFDGVDLADGQLEHARRKMAALHGSFEFHHCSMDELPFEPDTFDLVLSGMAFHEVPSEVRRGAIRESARVLGPGGMFTLADWSRPRFGLWGLLWLPFLIFEKSGDNWRNTYPELFRECGLLQEKDEYLNSMTRCQVFRLRS